MRKLSWPLPAPPPHPGLLFLFSTLPDSVLSSCLSPVPGSCWACLLLGPMDLTEPIHGPRGTPPSTPPLDHTRQNESTWISLQEGDFLRELWQSKRSLSTGPQHSSHPEPAQSSMLATHNHVWEAPCFGSNSIRKNPRPGQKLPNMPSFPISCGNCQLLPKWTAMEVLNKPAAEGDCLDL